MVYINRHLELRLNALLEEGKSILLLGPRQVGKTTLLATLKVAVMITLLEPRRRHLYEKDPQILADEIAVYEKSPTLPLIVIDEIQKVPALLDVIQYLIDQKKAQFILTGSSARKLKHGKSINLIPGRVILLKLDPLVETEYPKKRDVLEALYYGDLPKIVQSDSVESTELREAELDSYVATYLEEEIRAEALVRKVGVFSQFLELAAIESGNVINYSSISQDIGVSAVTVQSYFQILEDCLIAERIVPLTRSKTRKSLTQAPKFLLFDLGVRRLAAREGVRLSKDRVGHLFEQWVGLQLIRYCRLYYPRATVKYWRDHNGPEVDWVIDFQDRLIPIEVKWTDKPTIKDARHLETFCLEYPEATKGFVICRAPMARKLGPSVTALNWESLMRVFD